MDRLTIPVYNIMMKAVQLKQVDKDYRNHLQAFLNFAVKAEKKTGKNRSKPVYGRFEKFYNYKAELEKVMQRYKEKGRFAGLSDFFKKGV